MPWKDKYPAERLVPYDVGWPLRFARLTAGLRDDLGPRWEVEHVGSTSVPGLLAKPVIDVALRLPEGGRLSDWHPALTGAGWTAPVAVGDHWATFLLTAWVRTAIGHIFCAEQWPTAHVRLLAEWLRTHECDRDRYADLKTTLVARGTWGSDYTSAKSAFVQEIVNQARAARGLAPVGSLWVRDRGDGRGPGVTSLWSTNPNHRERWPCACGQLEVDDLDEVVERLAEAGVRFRGGVAEGAGGRQILVEDPSGNPIELFEAAGGQVSG